MKVSVLAALVIGVVSPGLASPEPAAAYAPASVCVSFETTYYTTIISPPANEGGHPRPPYRPTSVSGTTQVFPTPVVVETVIFSIVPEGPNGKKNKRDLEKRASGGFLSTVEDGIKNTCDQASTFALVEGELLSDGNPIRVHPSIDFLLFGSPVAAGSSGRPEQEVTRSFGVDPRGFLHWQNATFPLGEAYFCQLVSDDYDGQVYIILTAERSEWPIGCQPVRLQTYQGKSSFSLLQLLSFTTLTDLTPQLLNARMGILEARPVSLVSTRKLCLLDQRSRPTSATRPLLSQPHSLKMRLLCSPQAQE